jgi:hypothetical protein
MPKTYPIDIFKIYKDIWNAKRKSPILPSNYLEIVYKINTIYGTKFDKYVPVEKLDRFYFKNKNDSYG